ncbi:hypothetical protein [Denitromonas ohlonensis]|uniref:Uncharacterized protein n=2 Tax=Denitromonas TaxID=139331 RepID=A0A557S4D9_9RHOO|nr:hypothetical protein [Denitromonas ohlonensis]TVO60546.1 hypothetical protein FHP90_17820 [Denitromonas ohlonensis]TVO72276.1 hypothetical protein FHP89_18520 [Denitromonas ohlonensis]
MKEDHEVFNSLFIAAVDVYGPLLERCNRTADREKIFEAVQYVYDGFHKLHKTFPVTAKPLNEYLASRLQHHCGMVGCDSPHGDECTKKYPDGSDPAMTLFDYRVNEVKERLKAAGFSANLKTSRPIAPKAISCAYSAQHYQDAYERAGRVSDLVCFQKALQRELQ